MTLDEFKTIYAENPSADEVMEAIDRLYESESTLTESFATADCERNKLKKELDDIKARITKAEDILTAKTDLEKNEADLKSESERETTLKEKLKAEEERLSKVKEPLIKLNNN